MKFDIEKLQNILDSAVASGEECGLQMAIYDHGELAVNLCAGFVDRERTVKVTPSTLFPIYSCGKGIMTGAFHMLVERGLIRYGDHVADFWPEYACNGKENTLVWHALTHRAAVNKIPDHDSLSDLGNWELMCKKLAEAVPANEPGGKCAYHGITYAWLIGELASRASGVFFGDFIKKEIFEVLGIDNDFFFGTAWSRWMVRLTAGTVNLLKMMPSVTTFCLPQTVLPMPRRWRNFTPPSPPVSKGKNC